MLNATKLESNLDGSWLLLFNSKSGSFLSAFANEGRQKKSLGPDGETQGNFGFKTQRTGSYVELRKLQEKL